MRLELKCSQCPRKIIHTVERGHYSTLDILARYKWRAVLGGFQCDVCSGYTVQQAQGKRCRRGLAR